MSTPSLTPLRVNGLPFRRNVPSSRKEYVLTAYW